MSIPEPLNFPTRPATPKAVVLVVLLIAIGGVSCHEKDKDKDTAKNPVETAEEKSDEPYITDPSKTPPAAGGENIPRFGDNSPFDENYKPLRGK